MFTEPKAMSSNCLQPKTQRYSIFNYLWQRKATQRQNLLLHCSTLVVMYRGFLWSLSAYWWYYNWFQCYYSMSLDASITNCSVNVRCFHASETDDQFLYASLTSSNMCEKESVRRQEKVRQETNWQTAVLIRPGYCCVSESDRKGNSPEQTVCSDVSVCEKKHLFASSFPLFPVR